VLTVKGVRARVGTATVVAVCVMLSFFLPSAEASFKSTTTSPANGAAVDTLNPPGSFTYSRPCAPGAYVAPTFRNKSTATSATGASSISVSTPAGTAAGDYLVAAVTIDESDTSGYGGGGFGGGGFGGGGYGGGWGGWNVQVNVSSAAMTEMSTISSSDYGTQTTFYKYLVPATPPGSYSFTFNSTVSGAAVAILAYSGATGVAMTAGSPTTAATVTAPSIPSLTSAPAVLIAAMDVDDFRSKTIGTPASMTSRAAVSTTDLTSTLDKLAIFDQTVASTGATGTRTSALSATAVAVGASLVVYGTAPLDPTITLNWTIAPDTYATGYLITRSGSVTTPIGSRATLTWDDTTTSAATSYSYTIVTTYGTWRSTSRSVAVANC
jgi:hypothetical protein